MQSSPTDPDRLHLEPVSWAVRIGTKRTPICPCCAARLQTTATEFVGSVAYCVRCANGDQFARMKETQFLAYYTPGKYLIRSAGLLFYCPDMSPPLCVARLASELGKMVHFLNLPLDPWGRRQRQHPARIAECFRRLAVSIIEDNDDLVTIDGEPTPID